MPLLNSEKQNDLGKLTKFSLANYLRFLVRWLDFFHPFHGIIQSKYYTATKIMYTCARMYHAVKAYERPLAYNIKFLWLKFFNVPFGSWEFDCWLSIYLFYNMVELCIYLLKPEYIYKSYEVISYNRYIIKVIQQKKPTLCAGLALYKTKKRKKKDKRKKINKRKK